MTAPSSLSSKSRESPSPAHLPPLVLRLEPHTNTLWFGELAVCGHHRWEAALMAQVALGRAGQGGPACQASELNRALAGLGQRRPLNRKQISRLLQSLTQLFELQGHDFDARWRCAPRTRTVGPWWWLPQAGDRVSLSSQALSTTGRSVQRPTALEGMPRMAKLRTLPALLSMCQLALTYQPAWEGGPFAAVRPFLEDDEMWRLASPEMMAMRWLQLASSCLHTRQLEDGHHFLRRAQRILARDPVAAAYLGIWAKTLRVGLLRIDPDERRREESIEMLRDTLSSVPGSVQPEADRLSRLFLFAFEAIGEVAAARRALGRHARAEAAPHVDRALALYSASLFCAFTARHFDHMKSVLAHVGNLSHLLLAAGEIEDAQLPMQWFMLANQSRHKFGLVEDTWLIHTSLGHCWLSIQAGRQAFDDLCRQTPWAGPRPDELTFYTGTVNETRLLGDPRYHGKALINLVRFARAQHLALDLRRARLELRRLIAAHEGLAEMFEAEGWPALAAAA
jgi:hypothetical protein